MMIRSDDVAARLREEGITDEALELALENGRASGNIVLDEADGTFTTHASIENLTLWVRYREAGADVEIVDAYYHRMQVL